MKDKVFLDTNILVYTFDHSSVRKQKKAEAIVSDALLGNNGIISSQVVQEFLNVATKKFKKPFSYDESIYYLNNVLSPLCEVYPTVQLYQQALEIKKKFHFSFNDSLIIASALSANCTVLYSEDLQAQQTIFNLKIKNPF